MIHPGAGGGARIDFPLVLNSRARNVFRYMDDTSVRPSFEYRLLLHNPFQNQRLSIKKETSERVHLPKWSIHRFEVLRYWKAHKFCPTYKQKRLGMVDMWRAYEPRTVVKELGIEDVVNKELDDVANTIVEDRMASENFCGKRWPVHISCSLFDLGKHYLSIARSENIEKVQNRLRRQGFKGKINILLATKITEYVVNTAIERQLMREDMIKALEEMFAYYGRF